MLGLIITLSIIGGVILVLISILLVIEIVFKKTFYKRGDGAVCIIYQQFSSYPSLQRECVSFFSGKNLLRGFIYKDKNLSQFKAVIVLVHGIGYGHTYLFPLIEYLAKNGYIIFAYDQSGSGISEGNRIHSMTQGLLDLNKALYFKENNEEMQRYPTFLLGHSWGGYSVLSGLNYTDHKVQKVISVSGFNSEPDLMCGITNNKFIKPFIYLRNFIHYGKPAFYTAKKGLEKTQSKVLYMQGKDDKTVPSLISGGLFSTIDNQNLKVCLYDGRGHTPFVKQNSQAEQNKVMANLGLLGGVLTDYNFVIDYTKISEPDYSIYKEMLDFYNN